MFCLRRLSAWVLASLGLTLAVVPAGAQDACVPDGPEGDDLLLTPTPGTPEAVTLDAPIIARFPAGVSVLEVDAEPLLQIRSVDDDGGEQPVAGRYERDATQPNVLVFRPTGGLMPETSYVGDAVDPAGLEPRQLSFTTGTRVDEIAPRLRIGEPRVGSRKTGAQCGAVRIDVVFAPAEDDGPIGSIEHLVFQTRGAELSAPVLRQRVRAAMASEVSASFVLSEAQAADPICVQVLPVDGTGRVGEPSDPACFAPLSEVHFVGLCAARPPGAGPGAATLGAAALVLCALARRRNWLRT